MYLICPFQCALIAELQLIGCKGNEQQQQTVKCQEDTCELNPYQKVVEWYAES